MPKSPCRVPSYRLHKPSGQARAIVAGRHVYLGPYDSPASRERYGRLIAELAVAGGASNAQGVLFATGQHEDLLICELLAEYLDYASSYYVKDGRPTGHIHTIRRALRTVRALYENTPVNQFGPLALRAVQQRLVDEGRARHYINQVVDAVKRMFRWAASVELIPGSIYHDLKTVPGLKKGRTAARETEPIGPVSERDIEATLPHLPRVVADMVRFQRLTGCRPGEVCGLRPGDIDRSGGAQDVWTWRPASHKTEHQGRGRTIFIGPRAQEVLLPYLLREADAWCFSPAESEAHRKADLRACRKTPVQPSQVDRRKRRPRRKPAGRYSPTSYTRAIKRACAAANSEGARAAAELGEEAPPAIAPWHANQLRHAAATEIRKRYGLEPAQVVLGHATADVTQVYAERDLDLARRIVREVG